MAAIRSLLFIALLAPLFIFFESIPTSNSLTGIPRRNIFHTAAHGITNNSVIESSSQRKSNNNFHIKARRRIRPVLIGSNHRKSAANWSRVASFEGRRSPMEQEDLPVPQSAIREDFGKLQYGCEHYRRRCKIRAPCCDRIFTCRHCHNEAMTSLSKPEDRHELVRQDIRQVVCLICNTEQEVAKVCRKCNVNMGEYFCDICKFYDDDTKKKQFHCDACGICRVGGRENFFHCERCGSCYSTPLRDNHTCVENSMKSFCPICCEFLFDSIKDTTVMPCGHTIHLECFSEMQSKNQYRCPICLKTVVNMSASWALLKMEIECTPMPEEYSHEVSIHCNDCSHMSKVRFHILGHKCSQCNSFNTWRTSGGRQ